MAFEIIRVSGNDLSLCREMLLGPHLTRSGIQSQADELGYIN